MNFGQRVHRALEPIFAGSINSGWPNDFTIYDLAFLERIVVPGFEFIWVVRENGTHINPLGYNREQSLAEMVCFAGHPSDRRQFHHVVCTSDAPRIRQIDRQAAFQLAGAQTPMSYTYHGPYFGQRDHKVEVFLRDRLIASALMHERPRPMSGNRYVHCQANIVEDVAPVHQVLAKLQIEHMFAKIVGTLLVKIDAFDINGMPMDEWERAKTSPPVRQLSLIHA